MVQVFIHLVGAGVWKGDPNNHLHVIQNRTRFWKHEVKR